MQPRLLDDEVTFDAAASTGPSGRVLVVACGAIAREVLAVIDLNGWTHVTLQCLPGKLHNTPREIAGQGGREARGGRGVGSVRRDVRGVRRLRHRPGRSTTCVTAHGVDRLPGDHCYGFFAGVDAFAAMHEDNPFTFYLTDFLCRHFDRLVVQGLKLDVHPELLPMYFGNYRRLVYLSQTDDPALVERARAAAAFLGLAFEHRPSGYGDLQPSLERFVGAPDGR